MSGLSRVWALVARHRMFAGALAAGAALRAVTMLGFPPAIWFGGDSASYVNTALHLVPGVSRLSGYGLMLALLRPLHSFTAVTAVQHLMGLAIAVMIYAVARRRGLPGWGAALATLPVLLSAFQVQLEQEILPSAPFAFLVMAAVTLTLWWRQGRPLWATATSGALLALAALLWPVGLPLLALFLLLLLLRRAGWRAVTAAALAGTAPLALYLLWFNGAHGRFAFSNSSGVYLWSRTATFANCAVVKPPADERALCVRTPVADRAAASTYIWDQTSPINRLNTPKFSARSNALAMNFALRAIAAQPGGYAKDVARDVALSFAWTVPAHPSQAILRRYEFAHATQHWISPAARLGGRRTVAQNQRAYGGATSTTAVEPFAGWMIRYQAQVYFRGPLLGLVLLVGLGGIVRSWRRGGRRGWGGPGLYPWAVSAILLVAPVMVADFDPRYVLICVPVACLAGALAFATAPAAERAAETPGEAAPAMPRSDPA